MMDAAEVDECVERANEAFKKANDACTPTDCEKKFDAVYAETMTQCLADNGTEVICTP